MGVTVTKKIAPLNIVMWLQQKDKEETTVFQNT